MSTPYDGQLALWHWMGRAVAENSIGEVVDTLKAHVPNFNALWVKSSHGTAWQGINDNKPEMWIHGPEDLKKWIDIVGAADIATHAWCVPRGLSVEAEAQVIIEACNVDGLRSMLLDVEAGSSYFVGSADAASALIRKVRDGIPSDFHLGLVLDYRGGHPRAIYLDRWLEEPTFIQSLHPMVYHWHFTGGQDHPKPFIDKAYEVLSPYGLPIFPVLQAYRAPTDVPPEHMVEAARIAFEDHGATGVSYFRFGTITPAQYDALATIQAPGVPPPVEPEELPTNQDVVNLIYFEVAPQLGVATEDVWDALIAKAGWADLAFARMEPFDINRVKNKPERLTDEEWEVIYEAIRNIWPEELPPLPPKPPTPTRSITNQQVIDIIYGIAEELGQSGWALIEKADWEWLAIPHESRQMVFDPAYLETKPPDLTDEEWQRISDSIWEELTRPIEEPSEPGEVAWPSWWPWQHSLVGIHGRGDGPNKPLDFERFRDAGIETVKYLSRAYRGAPDPGALAHTNEAVRAREVSGLRGGPTVIVLRTQFDIRPHPPTSPAEYADEVRSHLAAFSALNRDDVLWMVEIHNEPNLYIEGLNRTWWNGEQFADWWLAVLNLLRPTMPASTQWGFPGLSPGPPMGDRGYDHKKFFLEAEDAWTAADWVGAHAYWQAPEEMTHPDRGFAWKWILETSGKPVAVTEFANTHPTVDKSVKGKQYAQYFCMLREYPGLLGIYGFISGLGGSLWREQVWTKKVTTEVGNRPCREG